jgi:hypothetical protein
MKSVENQEFCDQSKNESLVTKAMNYMGTHFLVFREKHVWKKTN